MSRLGFKSTVFDGDLRLGELDTIPVTDQNFQFPNNEIRIHYMSPQSERCPPLSILQTISSFSVRCKLESSSPSEQPHLINLHACCFYEFKTAVVVLGNEEIHLVAMPSKQKKFPCFWCYAVPLGLYNSSVGMLNLRCLAIVFDLDETLIVANTMKSFEDRMEMLRSWMGRETDPVRLAGMTAEMKRFVEDRALLKQYADSDLVVDNGKVLKVQLEEVRPMSGDSEKIVRPVIRLQERNAVLTRINPEIRDTSVLVRLRPAWEDLRSYLTAKGRKRFEVYVCTMAERDYALEMWRLLDPEAHLISPKQLPERILCVKSGSKKSLLNVFQNGICHPKMAMVIDDRLKVWEEKDQPRVHVVPPFLPYYSPQAETATVVPVLCVARNVACNVRGCFFKEFDENLLRRISELFYEDEIVNLPPAPDVSNYLMSEDAGFVPNGNTNVHFPEGMSGVEVERRLSQPDEKHVMGPFVTSSTELPVAIVQNMMAPTSSRTLLPSQKPSLLGAPIRRDSCFSDNDHDTKRRVVSMKHGVDLRNQSSGEPPILSRFPSQLSTSSLQPQGGWLVEDDLNSGNIYNRTSNQNLTGPSIPGSPRSNLPSHVSQSALHELQNLNLPPAIQPSEGHMSQTKIFSNSRELPTEAENVNQLPSPVSMGVLQEIGRRCSSKVEFRSVVSTSADLKFSFEVLFSGEKMSVGMGKTRKDAQQQAAENALRNLAEKYVAYTARDSGAADRDADKLSDRNDNGFLYDIVSPGSDELLGEYILPKVITPENGKP